MKRLRWQILIVVLALAAIAVLLLIEQPPAIVQPIQQEIQPESGGVYTEALIGSLGRLNPLLDYNNLADRAVTRLIFSGLIRFDDKGLPQADLAESWGISKDGKDYYFSLRAGARWHDGEPVTSEDVIFTIELLRSPEFPAPEDLRTMWEQIEVTAIDERTLQFRLPEPFSPFLDYLSFGILPQHLLDAVATQDLVDASFNLAPVGSGPFRFDHLLTKGGAISGVVLTSFADYYLEKPFLDQVVFQYYPDATSALQAYLDAEVSGISDITPETLAAALKQPNLRLYTSRLPQLTLIYFNLDNPEMAFFKDAQFRRALLQGINRQWLVDRILNGQAILADGPIFPGSWAYYEGIEHLNYDPDAALMYLKDAGYTIPAEGGSVRSKDGVALSFEMVYPGDALHTAMFEAIRRDWARLGVEVKAKPVTFDELLGDYLEPRNYQAALVDLDMMRSPDPDPYPFWDQAQITGGQNYANWNDRRASEYLELARVTTDITERTKAYRNFQVRFTQEMPALPLYYPVYTFGVDQQIQGVRVGPLFDMSDRFSMINEWYILTRRQAGNVQQPSPTP